MRMNRIPILTELLHGVAYDHINQMFNLWLKKAPPTPYLETACERSAHCILSRCCAHEIFNIGKTKSSSRSTEAAEIEVLETVLCKAGIFANHEPIEMTDDYFWVHVQKRKNVGSATDRQKEHGVEYTLTEKKLRERLFESEDIPRQYDEIDDGDEDDDDNVSVTSTVAGDNRDSDDLLESVSDNEDEELDEDEIRAAAQRRIKDATDALKSLGNDF